MTGFWWRHSGRAPPPLTLAIPPPWAVTLSVSAFIDPVTQLSLLGRHQRCCLDRLLIRFSNTAAESSATAAYSSIHLLRANHLTSQVIRSEKQQISHFSPTRAYPCKTNKASMRNKKQRPIVLDNNKKPALLFPRVACFRAEF